MNRIGYLEAIIYHHHHMKLALHHGPRLFRLDNNFKCWGAFSFALVTMADRNEDRQSKAASIYSPKNEIEIQLFAWLLGSIQRIRISWKCKCRKCAPLLKRKGKKLRRIKIAANHRPKITHFGISRNKLIKIFQIIFERNLRLQANISVRNLIIYIMSYLSNAASLFLFYFFVDLAKIIHNH